MAKTRKTKKEKMRAAQRVVKAPSPLSSAAPATPQSGAFTFVSDVSSSQSKTTQAPPSLLYLREDLLRTVIVIGAIILAEVTLFLTLSNR